MHLWLCLFARLFSAAQQVQGNIFAPKYVDDDDDDGDVDVGTPAVVVAGGRSVMWQEGLAVDSRLCAARKMDKELRPVYLKRRMQLIKAAEDEYEASQLGQVRKGEGNSSLVTTFSVVRSWGCVNSHAECL